MRLPKINSVTLEKASPLFAEQSFNIVVIAQEEVVKKAYLYDKDQCSVKTINDEQVFTLDEDDDYYSSYTGEEMFNFVQEVLKDE